MSGTRTAYPASGAAVGDDVADRRGETGIGRATLYKYFSDVGAILLAWHERHVTIHLAHLTEVRDQAGDTGERLAAVLGAYALIRHEHHDSELAALLHRGEHIARAQRQLTDLIRGMLTEAVESGDVRDDARLMSSRATASTRSQQPAACPPGPRSAGLSRSLWLGCTPPPDPTRF
jgi:AcrR family transcriptional regulator